MIKFGNPDINVDYEGWCWFYLGDNKVEDVDDYESGDDDNNDVCCGEDYHNDESNNNDGRVTCDSHVQKPVKSQWKCFSVDWRLKSNKLQHWEVQSIASTFQTSIACKKIP